LQEEERERRLDNVPTKSRIDVESDPVVDIDTKEMLKRVGLERVQVRVENPRDKKN
jgi:hypothetical protein